MAQSFQPKEILGVLANHGVKCVVLGGIASTLYGAPFPTSDVDVCPDVHATNLAHLANALIELDAVMIASDEPGGIHVEWSAESLKKWLVDFKFLNIQTKFGQLDLLYMPAGTTGYRDLARYAVTEKIDDVVLTVAALEDVIRSKQAAGRERDLQQLPTLRRLLELREEESH